MRGQWYQISLIFLAVIVTACFGGFLYRELFPEYKIYQNTYMALEEFRSSYTGQPLPPFEPGIKQIVIEQADKGPPIIDRCTSCHVAVQFSHFSPTQLATDINGNAIYDESGLPVVEPNPDDIWAKLDQKIEALKKEGKDKEAQALLALKTAKVGDHVYDMTKVLRAHPLIGRETRPFEFHSIEEYGCTVCHSGNGRGLTAVKAHGPVFDGQYEVEAMGPTPEFLEKDPLNDPTFAKVFNHKPGHSLLFQTTPIYVGPLIQANCVQCHETSAAILEGAARETSAITKRREEKTQAVEQAYKNEKSALEALAALTQSLEKEGWEKTLDQLEKKSQNYHLPQQQMAAASSQLEFIRKAGGAEKALARIRAKMESILGSQKLVDQAVAYKGSFDDFLATHADQPAGTIFAKKRALSEDRKLMSYAESAQSIIHTTATDENVRGALESDIDLLIANFHRGEHLYFSEACYACHRIDGFVRGGVGMDLTAIGNSYPWYIKESIVWPQADLQTSTMPNFHLDHEELEDLVTFLLAQKGRRQAVSETSYKARMLAWESGYKMPWEQPINPANLTDLRYAMTVFAEEGCAACHRLKGFESDVGFKIEKENTPTFTALYKEREWFRNIIPEEIAGSELVEVLESYQDEIDKRIVNHVRSGSLLEELESKHPKIIESFYADFKFAGRAKNHHFQELLAQAANENEKEKIQADWDQWKERVDRVLMMYVQEYGLGRLIGPRPNWSGIYRSDEWLFEHFEKPMQHVARSIMPVLPFDDSKFYSLINMLNRLAVKNRDEVRKIWDTFGFDPARAFDIHCSQCHGDHRRGNGPVSEWIYPIPKNLTNADFLRNFTRENAMISIIHGVEGGPMPPWGEVAAGKQIVGTTPVLTEHEVEQLVDWLYTPLEGAGLYHNPDEVDKWRYGPEDVLRELKNEGGELKPSPLQNGPELGWLSRAMHEPYLASLQPMVAFTNPSPEIEVSDIFDERPSPYHRGEKNFYYIKKRYYTRENLEEGRQFFELNCAVCHGREADGQGYRAGTMFDAKPRMLTNFHWVDSRDDLRLLRSIKFGVPGTSMVPWGDQTSSLQRLQLVMYIRSLSSKQEYRDRLTSVIYDVYSEQEQILQTSRVKPNREIKQLEKELDAVKQTAYRPQSNTAGLAVEAYEKKLVLGKKVRALQTVDQSILEMEKVLQKEAHIYQGIGTQMVEFAEEKEIFERYLKLIALRPIHYALDEGKLQLTRDEGKSKQIEILSREIEAELQEKIQLIEQKQSTLRGQLDSPARREAAESLNESLLKFKNLQQAFVSGFEEAGRLRKQQMELYANYENNLQSVEKQK